MTPPLKPRRLLGLFSRFAQRESLKPDLNRATRGTAAVVVPLVLLHLGHLPVESAYAVLAAQNVATVDVRGAYRLRFAVLLAMSVVLAACAGLGELVAPSLGYAVALMVVIAVFGGLLRHVTPDYGPAIAIASTLVFAISLGGHGDPAAAGRHMLAALAGGAFGLALQVALWPFRPQHPLRLSVSESWLALADVFDAMAPDPITPAGNTPPQGVAAARRQRIAEAESNLRTILDQTATALGTAAAQARPITARLLDLNREASLLATEVASFAAALDTVLERPDALQVGPSFLPVLTALSNTSRTVALAVVSRQPAHLATLELRVRRLTNLIRALESRVVARLGSPEEGAQLVEILGHISRRLPSIATALRSTIERSDERSAISLELFDLDTWKLRPLASALNLSPRIDPALVKFTLRTTVLSVIGIIAYKLLHLQHGYWLPFTMMVVLQPDYGSTRQRAAQRTLGTLAGAVLATAILGLSLPLWILMVATAATSFAFIYFIKRNYAVAVVFITLFVVLLTETSGPVDFWFAVERLASTTAGGLMALVAALLFWPVWEKERLPAILSHALRSNRTYLDALLSRVASGRGRDDEVVRLQSLAESANSLVFSSLKRMSGDPVNRQDQLQVAAALANGNNRLTRALNVLALHLETGSPPTAAPAIEEFRTCAAEALEALATATEEGANQSRERLEKARTALDRIRPEGIALSEVSADARRHAWIATQLGRAGTELGAMLLA